MLIAIIALLVVGMLFWLWRRSGRAIVLVAAIIWLAYPAVGVRPPDPRTEVNIRVDLLLFYPILLITGVLGLAFGLASRKSDSESGKLADQSVERTGSEDSQVCANPAPRYFRWLAALFCVPTPSAPRWQDAWAMGRRWREEAH
jgi:hypothetical protein